METWCFIPEEDDGFGLPPGIFPPSHPTTKATSEWGLMNNQSSVSRRSHDETLGQGIVEKAISDGPIDGLLDNVISDGQAVASKSSSTNTSFTEHESSSKDSSSVIDSNAQESSFVDLKLGMFSNYGDPKNVVTKVGAFVSCVPTKRVQSTNSNSSQTQICQVHGCNMDLSSSKPYHRKHRVCETHSKTTKVVVNGKTQRFCQQCSRFHFLTEFDGAKRSCRRRLTGHNERRRKPQIDKYTQRIGQSPQPYFGGKYQGSRTLFFRRNIFPLNTTSNEEHNHKKETLVTPVLPSCGKELTSVSSNNPKSTLSLSSYQHNGKSEVNALPAQRANTGLYGNSSSGCALYLLSNQLEDSSPYPSQNRMMQRLPFLNSYHSQQFESPIYDKILGLESQSSANVASSTLSLAGLEAIEDNDVGLHNLCDYNATNVGDNSGGILHTSRFIGSTNLVSHQNMNDTDVLPP